MHKNKIKLFLMAGFSIIFGVAYFGIEQTSAIAIPSVSISGPSQTVSGTLAPHIFQKAESSITVPIKINTTGVKSYTISVQAATSGMVGQSNKDNIIPSIKAGEAKTLQQLTNEWGYRYSFGNDNEEDVSNAYMVMPTTLTQLLETTDLPSDGAATTKYLVLGFGASVDNTKPVDIYQNKVLVSVLAQPIIMDTMFAIDTMQEMSTDICNNVPTPTSTATSSSRDPLEILRSVNEDGKSTLIPEDVLTDSRDNKEYIVRKLADGNCWMVQNLALAGGTTIHNTDSNITASSYMLPESSTSGFGSGSANSQKMFDGTF